ncbi:unnamed protein product [Didymodactylos carnosus]|uniref:Endonuclease/exonuclease/phosphatase domain-containing protein n=1 Tax=Didymodactylos carnosus TaxID=1234261 RepID=A0A814QIA1_9BILA|nr:unnamed protein product [Didymodactylos carnosus]CAF1146980.1 unnamed protein product [Didymodactylos carnosus]CAF3884535.1 unnamed protein product [Didymodactylos carnosus]CAF3949570.1 unnamed protein product [Didymodactylos carnosus]
MNDFNTKPYRLGRRPGEQGPRPLPSDQGRVEKLATGKNSYTTKNTQKLTLAKNSLTVGTWNVQTLWAAGKLELLRNEMKRFRYDIICISEVRWTGKGETSNGDFIWSGEETVHMRGVGFLLSAQAKKALIGYNTISSRIISARFDAAPFKMTAIHVYASTSASSEEDIEAFYNDIEKVITKTDKKDIIILTGDWNAKIGSENADWKSVMEPTCNLEEHANKIAQAIKDAVETTIPAKRKTKKPWISEATLKLTDEKRKLKQMKNVSIEYAQQYKDSCRRVKKSARQDKEHWINDQREQAEKGLNIGNTREAYSLFKTLRSEFVPRLNVIRDQQGTMLQAKDDIKQRWTQYCSSLYKDPGGGDGMVKELEDIAPP